MPTIRPRKKKGAGGKVTTVFHVQVRRSGFPARTGTFPTERMAKRWATTVEAEMIEGRHMRNSAGRRRTVGEGAIRYAREVLHVELPEFQATDDYEQRLAQFLARQWVQPTHPDAPADARNSLARLMWWRRELRDRKIADVGAELIEDKLSKLRTEPYQRSNADDGKSFYRTEKTINRYIAAGSRFFRIAQKRWHWISSNPFAEIERAGETGGRMKVLTVAQRARLFDEVRVSPTLYAFSMTARASVVRAGDLQKLEKPDVEFFEGEDGRLLGRLAIRQPKNREPRIVWIAGEPAQVLRDHIAASESTEPRVFVSPGRVYLKAGLRRQGRLFRYHQDFKEACERASLPGFTFHGWRHDGATDLARLGATEQQLRAIGGWKSNVVRKYVHLAAEDARDIVEQMNEKLLPGNRGKP